MNNVSDEALYCLATVILITYDLTICRLMIVVYDCNVGWFVLQRNGFDF